METSSSSLAQTPKAPDCGPPCGCGAGSAALAFEPVTSQGDCGCGGACGGSCASSTEDRTGTTQVLNLELEATAFAAWTSNQFCPASAWFNATAVKRVRAYWELWDIMGLLRCAPGFQVANKVHAAGAFNNIGTQQTAEGVYSTDWEDVLNYVDDKERPRC